MAFGDYVRVLRTFWKSILAVTLLGIAVGGGVTFAITPMYTATAQVLFTANAPGDGGGQDIAFGQSYVQGRMINYADLVTREFVLGPVVSLPELGLDKTPKQLGEHVSAEFAPTSTILTINVEDESRDQAARIAAAVAQSLIAQVATAELQAPVIDGEATEPRSLVNGQLVASPSAPSSPSSPKLQLFLAAGAMFGLIVGVALALIRFAGRNRPPRPAKEPKAEKAPKVEAPTAPEPVKPPQAVVPPKPVTPPVLAPPPVVAPPPVLAPPPVPQSPQQATQPGTQPGTQQGPLQPAERPQSTKRSGRRTRR